jgi:predicted ferric reductase
MISSVWWDLTRSSANVAWVIAVTVMMMGTLLATRFLRGSDSPSWLREIHVWLSVLLLVFSFVHVLSLVLDSYVEFSPLDVVVPMRSDYKTIPVALGVVALWILIVVQFTSLVKRRMSRSTWRKFHHLSYLAFPLLCAHALATGSDLGKPAFAALSVASCTAGALVLMLRVSSKKRRSTRETITSNPRHR